LTMTKMAELKTNQVRFYPKNEIGASGEPRQQSYIELPTEMISNHVKSVTQKVASYCQFGETAELLNSMIENGVSQFEVTVCETRKRGLKVQKTIKLAHPVLNGKVKLHKGLEIRDKNFKGNGIVKTTSDLLAAIKGKGAKRLAKKQTMATTATPGRSLN